MCAAREPRRFNGRCDTCCWFGHLSCDCLLQRDRISDVPTLSSPPQSNSGGPGYDIPCYPPQQTPPSYSGRNGGPGYDIPCYPPQQTLPSYSGRNGGPGYDIPCYPSQQTPPSYSGRSGGPGYDIPCYPPQQTRPSYSGRSGGPSYDIPCYLPQERAPRPFSSFVRGQRYNGGHSTAPPQHKYCGSNNGYSTNEGPQQQYGRGADGSAGYGATFPQQQPGPRPFSSFCWEQRYARRDGPQQSAPTAVTIAAAAPVAEAVTGTRVFPAVSSKSVVEAPASSAGAELAAVPAAAPATAAPATGGTVFPTASVGGAARKPASADEIAALTAAPATGGTVPFAASVGGAPASSAVAAASAEAAEAATSGNVPSATPGRGAVGARESSAGAVPSDAATEAAPSTDGIAAPAASTAREPRALASAAGSDGEICGERGASTHPFDPGTVCPLEVHFYNGSWLQHGSSSGSSSSSSNDNTSHHDSWWDATCVGALLRPFDPGKLCRRSTRRTKAVEGLDLPFDSGKAWERMQHGG